MPLGERLFMQLGSRLLPHNQPLSRAFTAGFGSSFTDYSRALACRDTLIGALENFLSEYDVLLCPVAPVTTYPSFPAARWRPPPSVKIDGQALKRRSA